MWCYILPVGDKLGLKHKPCTLTEGEALKSAELRPSRPNVGRWTGRSAWEPVLLA